MTGFLRVPVSKKPSTEGSLLGGCASSPPGSTLLDQWVAHCITACHEPPSFYAGARKIIRPYHFSFTSLDPSLELSDAGFRVNKLRALTKNYLHLESQRVAVELWDKRRSQENYGSVSFTTFNHFVKGDIKGATPRGSTFGPCLQSVVITHINKREYAIDVMYRSTELLKKFAPDVVLLRDILLKPFDFHDMKLQAVNFHFANVTIHTMYLCTIFPHLDDPIAELEAIKKADRHFYDWAVKWTARYLCPKYEHGIQKFSQALRVQKDALARIDPKTQQRLRKYLIDNHPGYSRTRFEHDEEEG
jgi:hypothetical protein